MSPKPAVSVTGGTIWGNRGAEAMLVTVVGKLREMRPGGHIYVFSYQPKQDRALVQADDITIISSKPAALVVKHFPLALVSWLLGLLRIRLPDAMLPKAVRALRDSDALLDIGGISFSDGREKFLPFNILLIWPAMLLGVPVIKLAQAVGPFKHPLNRLAAKLFLSRCNRVFARGAITAQHLEQLGLRRDRWERSIDVAFLYEPRYSLSRENEDRLAGLVETLRSWRQEGCPVIGIIPSSLVDDKFTAEARDYAALLTDLFATGAEMRFVLLPNATRAGSEKRFNNDLVVIEKVRQMVRLAFSEADQARIAYVTYDVNTAGTRALIEQCDVVVTSRFHGMVSALSLSVPTIVIGWSHKYAEVMAEFGLEKYALDFGEDDFSLHEAVTELLHAGAPLREQLRATLDTVRANAQKQFDYVEQVIA